MSYIASVDNLLERFKSRNFHREVTRGSLPLRRFALVAGLVGYNILNQTNPKELLMAIFVIILYTGPLVLFTLAGWWELFSKLLGLSGLTFIVKLVGYLVVSIALWAMALGFAIIHYAPNLTGVNSAFTPVAYWDGRVVLAVVLSWTIYDMTASYIALRFSSLQDDNYVTRVRHDPYIVPFLIVAKVITMFLKLLWLILVAFIGSIRGTYRASRHRSEVRTSDERGFDLVNHPPDDGAHPAQLTGSNRQALARVWEDPALRPDPTHDRDIM